MHAQVATLDAPLLEAAFAVRLAETHARQGREADMEEHLRRAGALLDHAAARAPDQAAHAATCAHLALVEGSARRRGGDLTAAVERYTAAVQLLDAAVERSGSAGQGEASAAAPGARQKRRGRAQGGATAPAAFQGSGQPATEACLLWQLHAALAMAHVHLAKCHALEADWAAAGSSCEAAESACRSYAGHPDPEQTFPVQMAAVCFQRAAALAAAAAAGRTLSSEEGSAGAAAGDHNTCRGRRKSLSRQGQADPMALQQEQLALLLRAHVLCPDIPILSRCFIPCHKQQKGA